MRSALRYSVGLCLVLIVLTILSCETNVDPVYKSHFIKYYGRDGDNEAKDFVVDREDGSVVMLGTTTGIDDSTRIYVVKADAEGKVQWSKTWGGGMNERAQDIELITSGTYAGGYLLLSNVVKNEEDSMAVMIRRIRPDGEFIDSLYFDPYKSQFASSILALDDGGFVFTGNTTDITVVPTDNNTGEDKEDLLIAKFSESKVRDDSWDSFGGEELGMGVKILKASSGYNFFGHSNAPSANPGVTLPQSNFWFAYISSTGLSGSSFFGGSTRQNEFLTAAAKSGNSYVAVGTELIETNQVKRIYIIGFNKPFSSMEPNTDDGSPIPFLGTSMGPDNSEGVGICESTEGNAFWVLGNEITRAGRNIWVEKIIYSPEAILQDRYKSETKMRFGGSNNDDTASAIEQLPNGDLLILATMQLEIQKKMALIKVRPNGSFD